MLPDAPRLPHNLLAALNMEGGGGGTSRSLGRAKRNPESLPSPSCPLLRLSAGRPVQGWAWGGSGRCSGFLRGAPSGPPWPGRCCSALFSSAAPRLAASHPGALMERRQALGCSLSVPVAGSGPRWNVGGLRGLGLPTLPKPSSSFWGGSCGSLSPFPGAKSPQKLRALLGQAPL